jgi:hypothetical protein
MRTKGRLGSEGEQQGEKKGKEDEQKETGVEERRGKGERNMRTKQIRRRGMGAGRRSERRREGTGGGEENGEWDGERGIKPRMT